MDIRSIRYFMEVAKELNITRAAENLHMAQPPLSRQIQLMEEELGVQLFRREKKRLYLTGEGEILLHRGEQLITLLDKTEAEIRAHGKGIGGTLYIGTVEGNAPHILSGWMSAIAAKYPNVQFNLWNGSSDDVISRLSKGICDIGLIVKPYDNERLEGISVSAEPWTAMLPASHPLAKAPGTTMELKELVGVPLIVPARKSRTKEIVAWFALISEEPKIRAEISSYLNAYELVRSGMGVAIFPSTEKRQQNDEEVVSKVIVNPTHLAEYVLVWDKEKTLTGIAEVFVREVQDMLLMQSM